VNRSTAEPRDLFAIADLAREFGISTRTIRFYEAKGLLTPERVGGARIFRRRDRARLILILRGKRLGFSLRDISDYLSLYDAHSQAAQVALLVGKVEERLGLLEEQQRDLETTIAELREIRQLARDRLEPEPNAARPVIGSSSEPVQHHRTGTST
jgi:DNA-binding transcriptional MerR regulator